MGRNEIRAIMIYSTQAIVLKKILVAEADAIVVLYTHDFGKMRVYAQGVQKEGAKLRGHVEPLSLIAVQFVMGMSGERLTYAQMMQPWFLIRKDFDRMSLAVYITELVDTHCLVGQPDKGIWELLVSSLIELNQEQISFGHRWVGIFELGLMRCLGYEGVNDISLISATPLTRPQTVSNITESG